MRRLNALLLSCSLLVVGCGSSSEDIAQFVADPTGQRAQHVQWNAYNLYRYEGGNWIKVVSLTQQIGNIPDIGAHPALIAHGLGGSFRDNSFTPLAQNLLDTNTATSVYGFEYDSQDSIGTNAVFFTQAVNVLNQGGANRTWDFIGHSMGGLVMRSAIQLNNLPVADSDNRYVSLATPNAGSPVMNVIASADVATQTLAIGVLNQTSYFTNADGTACDVNFQNAGFQELRTDSGYLAQLNQGIGSHPKFSYYAMAGTERGQYAELNSVLGVDTNDGLVTLDSANTPLLNPAETATAPVDHSEIKEDTFTVFPFVDRVLKR